MKLNFIFTSRSGVLLFHFRKCFFHHHSECFGFGFELSVFANESDSVSSSTLGDKVDSFSVLFSSDFFIHSFYSCLRNGIWFPFGEESRNILIKYSFHDWNADFLLFLSDNAYFLFCFSKLRFNFIHLVLVNYWFFVKASTVCPWVFLHVIGNVRAHVTGGEMVRLICGDVKTLSFAEINVLSHSPEWLLDIESCIQW